MAWGQVIVAVMALVGVRVYTELLTPSQFGAAMLAVGAISLFDSMGVLALNQTILASCGPQRDPRLRRVTSQKICNFFLARVMTAASFLSVCGSVVLAVTTGSLWWLVLPAIVASYIFAEVLKVSLTSLLVLDGRFRSYSAWMASESVATVACVAVAVKFWRPDAIGFCVGYAAAHLLNCVMMSLVLDVEHWRTWSRAKLAREERGAVKKLGVPIAFMGPLGWVSTYLDRYILGATLGTATTGVYAAVAGLVSRPYGLTTAILTNYFRPQFFNPSLRSTPDQTYASIMRSWIGAACLAGTLGVVLFGFAGPTVASLALAPEFRKGAPVLMVLFALAQTFTIMTHAADNAILSVSKSAGLLKAQSILAIATLVFIPLGIFFGGVSGGVVGRLVAEVVKFASVLRLAVASISSRSKEA